ncbi:MAG: hypothetical protein ACD_4C00409G0002 [uncultured bacterium (gcode 4)]|uniref:Uncharacterized protein n=1 Tax=uncultured bacterium (gcode 4) TaxID=1234023 RepID=K2FWB6_9BACT|nr:MAG: hypothetical protein ACD_4C00409G0002 [uncultured bacterium (gcode 4)]
MINLIDYQNIEKINANNLKQIINYIFKDYPDIIRNYFEIINELSDRIDLIDKIVEEIKEILIELNLKKENLSEYEEKIIISMRNNFFESNKLINNMATKIIIEKQEKYEKNTQDLESIFANLI